MCVWEKMRENHTKCVKLDRSVCAQQKNKEFMEYSHYAKRNVSKNLSLLSLLRMKSTLKASSFFYSISIYFVCCGHTRYCGHKFFNQTNKQTCKEECGVY